MRKLACFFMVLLLLSVMCVPVMATQGTGARADAVLDADGSCQVTLSLTLQLDQAGEVRFPVPGNARGITLNGAGASTRREGDFLMVDLSRITGNAAGSYSLVLRYTVPNTVAYTEAGEPQVDLMLLCGFAYPITDLAFSLTLPEQVQFTPRFISGYHQQGFDTEPVYEISGNQLYGVIPGSMKDLETLSIQLQLTQETFPRSAVERWSAGATDIIAYVLMGLAALYWIIFLRSAPHLRQDTLQPPEGSTAGEMRCALIGQGADLTTMVMSWAQLGYILIHLKENGRVVLHKRMDMGNERGSFENKVFRTLFGKKNTVDGSGYHYARLYRQVAASKGSVQELFKPQSGNVKLLRILGTAAGAVAGASLGIGLAGDALLAIFIVLIMAVAGGVASWAMESWVEGLHLRNRGALVLALVLCVAWLALGIVAGNVAMAIVLPLFQLLLGLAGGYGGRRTMSGRAITSQILGLRANLRKLPEEELERVRRTDPDYFFDMMPYALALGVDKPFAEQFGRQRMNPCPWLTTGMDGHMTAPEWAREIRRAAESLDEHQKRLPLERLMGK